MEHRQAGHRPESISAGLDFDRIKNALKRGAYLVAANWPVVIVQFVAESTFKLLLAVPIVGGTVLVAIAAGRDLTELVSGGWRAMIAGITDALIAQPVALGAFGFAFLSVLLGGSTLMFLVKGGTLTVLVQGDRVAGPLERPPLRMTSLQRAGQFSINLFLAGSARLFRRYLILGMMLLAVYAASGGLYLALVVAGFQIIENAGLRVVWTVIAGGLVTLLVIEITLVNLFYLLTQMVIASGDEGIRSAIRQVLRFVRSNLLELAAIFGVVLAFVLVATVGSVLATAGLGLVSFVPLVGLAVFPLQVVAWLVRGLVFQYLGLTAFGAYLGLYGGHQGRVTDTAPASTWIRTA
jgi:hypothetical protein